MTMKWLLFVFHIWGVSAMKLSLETGIMTVPKIMP